MKKKCGCGNECENGGTEEHLSASLWALMFGEDSPRRVLSARDLESEAECLESVSEEERALFCLNAAFLALLGESEDLSREAEDSEEELFGAYLEETPVRGEEAGVLREAARFYKESLHIIAEETGRQGGAFQEKLVRVRENMTRGRGGGSPFWEVFFPEGARLHPQDPQAPEEGSGAEGLSKDAQKERVLEDIRKRRFVKIDHLNDRPIERPAEEMLFASNILLTVPEPGCDLASLPYSEELKALLKEAQKEDQQFWYDHPIPIGTPPAANEILYGLKALDEAAAYEKNHSGLMRADEKLTCVLSVTVTHKSLQKAARLYLEEEFRSAAERAGTEDVFPHLEIVIFTEDRCEALVRDFFLPGFRSVLKQENPALTVFGVDGEYGRHYSFLKAILPLWRLCYDSRKKAVFKIDLDQVFIQDALVKQTGKSVLGHFMTPLWGARGKNLRGEVVDLSMIAGALVNEKDFDQGLFAPDVRFEEQKDYPAEEAVFYSRLPQALSTEAEMMTRYEDKTKNPDTASGEEAGSLPDGRTSALSRIHITGGTNGILEEALRKYRPFTPSFIGRAEDQAYLLSALDTGAPLAYLHAAGLIMRHDKEAFAQAAMKTAAAGKQIGDYVRILYFSAYARALSPGTAAVKEALYPFTGCFISEIPFTVAVLRFALKAATLQKTDPVEGGKFIRLGTARLLKAGHFAQEKLAGRYRAEKEEWNRFYDLIEALRRRQDSEQTLLEKGRRLLEKSFLRLSL